MDGPFESANPEEIMDTANAILHSLSGSNRHVACGACAMAAFMLFRGSRTVEQDMDLLKEFYSFVAAHQADEGQQN